EPERVLQRIEPLAGHLVAAVRQPAVGLEQDGRPEGLVRVPTVTRAAGRAAGAQDAFVEAVELLALGRALQPLLAGGRRRDRLQPRLDRGILRVEVREVRHEVLDDLHVRKRRDAHLAGYLLEGGGAGESVLAVHVHRARPADAFAARAAEGQRRVDLVLDLDQRVEEHRPAFVEVDGVAVEAWVGASIGIVAVDLEGLEALAVLGGPGAALLWNAVSGKEELGQRMLLAWRGR